MKLRDLAFRVAVRCKLRRPITSAEAYAIAPGDFEAWAAGTQSALAADFLMHEGRLVRKWVHYLEVYEPHFARFAGSGVRMLEIGISQGGSLELWRKYFGANATIFGVDVDPACMDRVDPPNQARIGSQDDPEFLRRVVSEMGGIDIVLDDGSHIGRHQRASFETLFPLLADGGLYVIEDIHTSYWPGSYEGGYRRPGTAIEWVKSLIDGMQAPFHHHPAAAGAKSIPAIHVYNWTVVIEKRAPRPLGHFKSGSAMA